MDNFAAGQIQRDGRVVHGYDDNLYVEFFTKPIENKAKSQEAGRPIFDEKVMVRILIPGDKNTVIEQVVTNQDRQRFHKTWERWEKANDVGALDGTPLKEWPAMSVSQIAELNAINIYTVEGLANLPDSMISKVGMGGRELVAKAKAYIQAAADSAVPEKLAQENEVLRNEIEILKEQVKELAAKVGEDTPRRGRKPKGEGE